MEESQETVQFELKDLNDFVSFFQKSFLLSKDFRPKDEDVQDLTINEVDPVEAEMSLIHHIARDDKDRLISGSKSHFQEILSQEEYDQKENRDPQINQSIDHSLALRLLQIACKFDSVKCAIALIEGEIGPGIKVNEFGESGRTALHSAAELHSKRCTEFLLSRLARTDLRSKDGNAQIALEMALSSNRMVIWTSDETIEDLLVSLSEMDLSVVKMLAEATKDIAEVAYVSAMEGKVVWLAALLMVVPEKVTSSIIVLRPDGILASKETTTIYECVIREALSLGQKEGSSRGSRWLGLSSSERRKMLLGEIELLQPFGATIVKKCSNDRRAISPLIRASQAGDEEVIRLLLKTNIDINETDGEGNSALHWYLRTSSNTNKPRIAWLLLKHGASARQRNRLGLTPVHVAAANGYYHALQILLLKDPEVVDSVSEMKETPLFFAVKNDFLNCAKLLLCYSASTQLTNLRKQRPIDLAKSQDMRFLLSQTNSRLLSQALPRQEHPTWPKDDQSDSDGEMSEALNTKVDSCFAERPCPAPKTEICRYYDSPGGCVRGANCYYAHSHEELCKGKLRHPELKKAMQMVRSPAAEESKRKIFIGGLPPSVDTDTLREIFQDQFGSVEDAVVMGCQAKDQIQTRGFGFVTFKTEESVAAAVRAHYVAILGKTVEIKGAVPKPAVVPEITKPTPRQQKQYQNELQVTSPSDIYNVERGLEPTSWVERLMHSQKQRIAPEESQVQLTDAISGDQNLPPWVITFKKWLPGFLQEVFMRLREGEWYPLSSLKGDFRATCGLELDHTSLGYVKLSDFMRSFPGICRMKVVPVSGRGPATHMVLLPNHPRQQQQQQQFLANTDENDYVEELMISLGNFGYVGSGEGTSSGSGPQEKSSAAEEENSRFLTFLKPDSLFLGRPWYENQSSGGGEGGEENDKYKQLRALNNSFSFFARQYDFYNKYDAVKWEKKCFKCKAQIKLVWSNQPCGHLSALCNDCKLWINKLNNQKAGVCLHCDSEVKSSKPVPWPQTKNDKQDCDSVNDAEFPAWDPDFISKPKGKKKWWR